MLGQYNSREICLIFQKCFFALKVRGTHSKEISGSEAADFQERHIGPSVQDQKEMLSALGSPDLEDFVSRVVPVEIFDKTISSEFVPHGCKENHALDEIFQIAKKNLVKRSLIGLGYYGTAIPSVIQRNILENPAWYTAYTPYQAEISQGRLEALFNFQTLISELTGLPICNASLLDEATAAAEAMTLSYKFIKRPKAKRFLVDIDIFPQTLAVLRTRAQPIGIEIEVADPKLFELNEEVFGILLQLPGQSGRLWDPTNLIADAHDIGALATVAIDPLAQVLMAPLGDLGVDIAIGSAQRFGLPLGFGGPHAAFFATKEILKRQVPGRLVGKSFDLEGNEALRLALQTREQHIRREKATSNICTAQVLLAVMASFFAVYHGPEGLEKIARKIVFLRLKLEKILIALGYPLKSICRFDFIEVYCSVASEVHKLASLEGFNLRVLPLGSKMENALGFGISIDQLSTEEEVTILGEILAKAINKSPKVEIEKNCKLEDYFSQIPLRKKTWLEQPVFQLYRSETQLMRYMKTLADKDFSLMNGMIPLGSCTMKLNAATELLPLSWREFSSIHPFAPSDQSLGFDILIKDLEKWLADLTGFSGVSLQPNAGSQGEFAGLLVIRKWHKSRGEGNRNICLIPTSAHGTNPASAIMAGMEVVSIECDSEGNIDLNDLQEKAKKYAACLSSLMITYPSTHGVFEPNVCEICKLIHEHGGQVYLDGANLNAQIGLCRPGIYGADVCHLNLHKTFCIPHGGGGPGIGPIAVASHLVPFLPGHVLVPSGGEKAIGDISAAPWGSAGILPISWLYIRMMGSEGLRKASSVALLSANYIANKLEPYYPILFKGPNGLVAHECILDLRQLKKSVGVEVEDVAKRLMDYGFHAPTVSWPVMGTLMVEPTESENLFELNRFCEAMISIRLEIKAIELGQSDPSNNPLKRSPHSLLALTSDHWDRPYSRSQAAFPTPFQRNNKIWPAVARIDNVYGDRNLVCACN